MQRAACREVLQRLETTAPPRQRSNFFRSLEPEVLAELPRMASFMEAKLTAKLPSPGASRFVGQQLATSAGPKGCSDLPPGGSSGASLKDQCLLDLVPWLVGPSATRSLTLCSCYPAQTGDRLRTLDTEFHPNSSCPTRSSCVSTSTGDHFPCFQTFGMLQGGNVGYRLGNLMHA